MFNRNNNDSKKENDIVPAAVLAEPQKAAPRQEFPARSVSYVGPALHFEGRIKAEEGLVIEGEVEGTVESGDKSLTVGKQGRVHGDLHGTVIEIRGKVDGEVYGRELVRLFPTAVIEGTIHCSNIVMEEGAVLNGTVDMDWDGKRTARTRLAPVQDGKHIAKVAG